MDEALVEDAEDDVDDDQRRQDQQRYGGQGFLERLSIALEGRRQRGRQAQVALSLLHGLSRLTERHAGREVEADGDRRELRLVTDRQRRDRRRRPFGEGAERHHLAARGRTDVDEVQALRVALQVGPNFLNHVVGVDLGEILRDLPLAVGVVQRVVDQLRLDAEARRHVAIDRQMERRAGVLLIGGDVAQLRKAPEFGQNLRSPKIEFVRVGVLERVLELRPGEPRADGDVLRDLEVEMRAIHLRELGP